MTQMTLMNNDDSNDFHNDSNDFKINLFDSTHDLRKKHSILIRLTIQLRVV